MFLIKYGLSLFAIITTLFFLFLIYRSVLTKNNPQQVEFFLGKVPQKLNGAYKGSVGIETSWKGKKFDATTQTGINLIGSQEKYPFKTYVTKGQVDFMDVLKIDYNIPSNSWWLRFVLDELVQVDKDKYLGKLHIVLSPDISVQLGFFRLEK